MQFSSPVVINRTYGLVLVVWLISNIFPILTELSAGLFLRCCFDVALWNSMDAELLPRHCVLKLGLEANPNRSPFSEVGSCRPQLKQAIPPPPELILLEKRQRKPPLVLTGFILKLATGNRKGGPGSELTSQPLGRLTWVTSQSGGKIWIQGLRVPGHSMDSGQYFVSQRTP